MADLHCPIWDSDAQVAPINGDVYEFDSPRAGGKYQISGTAVHMLKNQSPRFRAKLTTWLIDQRRSGVSSPLVKTNMFSQIESRRTLYVSEKKERFFRLLMVLGYAPGDDLDLKWDSGIQQYVSAWTECENDKQFRGIVQLLQDEQLLLGDRGTERLSPTGFECLEKIEVGGGDGRQAFVAMWLDDETSTAYADGIEPAVRDAGYEPFRIDRKEHANKIDDEIIAEIRRSRFLVADFTCKIFESAEDTRSEARGGVYYEAGFAQGLGIPVIWAVRKDCMDYVHFDTRQFAHIDWENPEDLRHRLRARIAAVIGVAPGGT